MRSLSRPVWLDGGRPGSAERLRLRIELLARVRTKAPSFESADRVPSRTRFSTSVLSKNMLNLMSITAAAPSLFAAAGGLASAEPLPVGPHEAQVILRPAGRLANRLGPCEPRRRLQLDRVSLAVAQAV